MAGANYERKYNDWIWNLHLCLLDMIFCELDLVVISQKPAVLKLFHLLSRRLCLKGPV